MALVRGIFLPMRRGGVKTAANNFITVTTSSFLKKKNTIESNRPQDGNLIGRRAAATTASTRSGAILPEPKTTPFGFFGVIFGVVLGLFIGAAISKNVANFLEENDLFVPSDDDDDDD